MGWSFNMDRSQTKAQFVNELNHGLGTGYVLLKHRVVGNHLWQLVQRPDGTKFICLCLMSRGNGRGGRDWHGWGYKGISEDMGPVEVDCPLTLLREADPPQHEYSKEWRERVYAYHAARRARPKPEPGKVVEYASRRFRLAAPAGRRRGWIVHEVSDGARYRLTARQLAHAAFVQEDAR